MYKKNIDLRSEFKDRSSPLVCISGMFIYLELSQYYQTVPKKS